MTRVILIGGTSHAGKTTLAEAIAERLEWPHVSTDSFARHPGRPWKSDAKPFVPDDVAQHYLSLTVDELITDVLRHYKSMWPGIETLVQDRASDQSAEPLILEGSALWPESVATLEINSVSAIWLTTSGELLKSRIRSSSRFEHVPPVEQALIDKFIARSVRYNELMMETIQRLGLVSVNVEPEEPIDDLVERCLAQLVG